MIKLLDKAGKLLVKLYFMVAKGYDKKAKAEAVLSKELANKAMEASKSSMEHLSESAKIATKAQEMSRMFSGTK